MGMPALAELVGRCLTAEEYVALPESKASTELIHGVFHLAAAALDRHQLVSYNLSSKLGRFCWRTRLSTLRESPSDVRLTEEVVVQPGLYLVLRGNSKRLTRRGLEGRPIWPSRSSPPHGAGRPSDQAGAFRGP